MKKLVALVISATMFTASFSAFAHWYCSTNNNYTGAPECTVEQVRIRTYLDDIWVYAKLGNNSNDPDCNYLLIKGVSDEQAKAMQATLLTAFTTGTSIMFRASSAASGGYCYTDQLEIGR